MSKKKVLLLTGDLAHYRVPIYEIINKDYDLTVAYLGNDFSKGNVSFAKVKLHSISIGSVTINGLSFFRLCTRFDVVIVTMNMHYISFALLPILFKIRKTKIISWSIGIRASYSHKFDLKRKKTSLDYLFYKINCQCDAVITYSKESIDFYDDYHVDKSRYFVAHNTVAVNCDTEPTEAKSILLFVGTLYKEKNIYELVHSYYEAYMEDCSIPRLYIIGDGPEQEGLKKDITEKNLGEHILLCGRITDESVLKNYFIKSIICISPNQAGLSVLKSLGYGVPFVTRSDAITGGEILNVKDGYNGILYKKDGDLKDIILKTNSERDFFSRLGHNAYEYYHTYATPEIMAGGVTDAIKYTFKMQ